MDIKTNELNTDIKIIDPINQQERTILSSNYFKNINDPDYVIYDNDIHKIQYGGSILDNIKNVFNNIFYPNNNDELDVSEENIDKYGTALSYIKDKSIIKGLNTPLENVNDNNSELENKTILYNNNSRITDNILLTFLQQYKNIYNNKSNNQYLKPIVGGYVLSDYDKVPKDVTYDSLKKLVEEYSKIYKMKEQSHTYPGFIRKLQGLDPMEDELIKAGAWTFDDIKKKVDIKDWLSFKNKKNNIYDTSLNVVDVLNSKEIIKTFNELDQFANSLDEDNKKKYYLLKNSILNRTKLYDDVDTIQKDIKKYIKFNNINLSTMVGAFKDTIKKRESWENKFTNIVDYNNKVLNKVSDSDLYIYNNIIQNLKSVNNNNNKLIQTINKLEKLLAAYNIDSYDEILTYDYPKESYNQETDEPIYSNTSEPIYERVPERDTGFGF